jgi:hypothetical protein
MQRKAHLLFLPASRRVRGEFERELPLIYGVKLTQLAGLGRAHILVWFEWDKNWAKNMGVLRHPPCVHCPLNRTLFSRNLLG